jgi:hypothetical protein
MYLVVGLSGLALEVGEAEEGGRTTPKGRKQPGDSPGNPHPGCATAEPQIKLTAATASDSSVFLIESPLCF